MGRLPAVPTTALRSSSRSIFPRSCFGPSTASSNSCSPLACRMFEVWVVCNMMSSSSLRGAVSADVPLPCLCVGWFIETMLDWMMMIACVGLSSRWNSACRRTVRFLRTSLVVHRQDDPLDVVAALAPTHRQINACPFPTGRLFHRRVVARPQHDDRRARRTPAYFRHDAKHHSASRPA